MHSEPPSAPPPPLSPAPQAPGTAPLRARRAGWWKQPLTVTSVLAVLLHLPFTPAVPFFRTLQRLSILRDPDKSWDYQQEETSLPIELLELPKAEPADKAEDDAIALPLPPPAPHAQNLDKKQGGQQDKEAGAKKAAAAREEEKKRAEKALAEKTKEAKGAKGAKSAKEAAASEAGSSAGKVQLAQGSDEREVALDDDGKGEGATVKAAQSAEDKAQKPSEAIGLKGKLSDNLVGKPNVTLALWMPEIRAHALGSAVGGLLSCAPEWRPFLQKGIDPLSDIEGFMATGPQLSSSDRMTVAVQHNLSAERLHDAIDALVKAAPKTSKWLTDDAAKIWVQRRERVMFPHPRDMVFVTPSDAWQSIHALDEPLSLPAASGRAVTVQLLKPSRPLRKLGLKLPEQLTELRLDVFANRDGSVDLRMDFEDESDASASDNLATVNAALSQFFGDLSQVARTVTSLGPVAADDGPLSLPSPDFAAVGKRLTATLHVTPAQSGKLLALIGKAICPKKPAHQVAAPQAH